MLSSLITPPTVSYTQNPVVLGLETNNANCNFINLKLWIETLSGSSQVIAEQQLEPDGSSQVYVDIAELLHASMDDDLWPLPNFTTPTTEVNNSKVRKYWLEAEELEDGIPNGEKFTIDEGDPNYAICGGLAFQAYPNSNFWSAYMSGLSPSYPFLTWKPPYAETRMDQPEFLAFYSLHAGTIPSKLKVVISYDDASTTTIYKFPAVNLTQYNMYTVPAGYAQLELEDHDTPTVPKAIVKWTVQLVHNVTEAVLSGQHLFVLNRNYMGKNKRCLMFYNSLGGFDFFTFYGEFSSKQQLTGQPRNHRLSHTYARHGQTRSSFNRYETLVFKGSSGYQPKGVLEYLREIGLSPMLYEVKLNEFDSYVLTAIEVTSADIPFGDDQSAPQECELEYSPLFNNSVYTRGFIS
jgi:hypothetical protein